MATQQGGSEVVRLMQQIELEHEAACFALSSPALGTAQHWFITRHMEQIDACRVQLAALIGEQTTMEFLVQVTESAPALAANTLAQKGSLVPWYQRSFLCVFVHLM